MVSTGSRAIFFKYITLSTIIELYFFQLETNFMISWTSWWSSAELFERRQTLLFCMVDVLIDNTDDEEKILHDAISFPAAGLHTTENCNIFLSFLWQSYTSASFDKNSNILWINGLLKFLTFLLNFHGYHFAFYLYFFL